MTIAALAGLSALLAPGAPASAAASVPAPAVAEVPDLSTSSPAAAEAAGGASFVTEKEGIRIEAVVRPLRDDRRADQYQEGDPVEVRFRITDTATNTPMPGLYPAAWMDLVPAGADDGSEACREKLEAFIGGSILAEPEVDLNVYYVLALNDDATISVVDPIFGFGGSKLLEMVFLASPGYDWALTEDGHTLFVSMPDAGRVAVVKTDTWEVSEEIDTGGRPGRLALQEDGRFLWATDDSDATSGVVVIDTRSRQVAHRIATGLGPHDFAFGRGDLYAFVSNRDAGTLSVIDIGRFEKVAEVEVGERPVSLDDSSIGAAIYLADEATGEIVAVDQERHQVVARMQAEPGLGQLRIAPDGRHGLVVNPVTNTLSVFDTAINRIVQEGAMEDEPEHVAFSDELAYIRHRGSDTIFMIPLDEIGRQGQPVSVADFPGGQRPPGLMAAPTPAVGIIQAPGANAVLVSNPGDEMIYFYKEGMAAPMGSFRNYGRQPRAVLVLDNSLREQGTGIYKTNVELRRPGRYDLALFLDSPRLHHCFSFEVVANPELERRRLKEQGAQVTYLDLPDTAPAGEPLTVRFQLTDPVSGEPLDELTDVQVLTFLIPGTWQIRHWAEAQGDGVYQTTITPPRAGHYRVQTQALSAGLAYNRSPSMALVVEEPAPVDAAVTPER